FGDYLYIKNNFPNQMNLCYEAHKFGAGEALWKAHAAGKANAKQQQVFANPCPEEELFKVSSDPHQLTNVADSAQYAAEVTLARKLLAGWTEQTGDTIPKNPTPHRHAPPRIENGKIIPPGKGGQRRPKGEFPGAAKGATKINHPGPVLLPED
ncbi:MAG: heparan N-sulfatase, partial [Pirellulales bacterium]|nr:heparan N-sulfatase [Pirellulales bacterium]